MNFVEQQSERIFRTVFRTHTEICSNNSFQKQKHLLIKLLLKFLKKRTISNQTD